MNYLKWFQGRSGLHNKTSLILFGLILLTFFFRFFNIQETTIKPVSKADKNWLAQQKTAYENSNNLTYFNPNDYTEKDWQNLGFSPKQATVIIKYRNKLGGFKQKEDLKKCFVIKESQYQKIMPYLLFDNQNFSFNNTKPYKNLSQTSTFQKLFPFDANRINIKDWEKLGFSPKQATIIVKYRTQLGGFKTIEDIASCFVISPEKFTELKPYIHLKQKQQAHHITFNPNNYNLKDWQINWGLSEKQALSILKYKNSLGGNFSNLTQIQNCFVISDALFNEMKPYIQLNIKDHNTPEKLNYKLNEATLNQLIQTGIKTHEAQRIINFRTKQKIQNWETLNTLKISSESIRILQEKFSF